MQMSTGFASEIALRCLFDLHPFLKFRAESRLAFPFHRLCAPFHSRDGIERTASRICSHFNSVKRRKVELSFSSGIREREGGGGGSATGRKVELSFYLLGSLGRSTTGKSAKYAPNEDLSQRGTRTARVRRVCSISIHPPCIQSQLNFTSCPHESEVRPNLGRGK